MGLEKAINDSEFIEHLNGARNGEEIRASGNLILPSHDGGQIVFDLVRPFRPRDELVTEYWRAHPRFLFFKGVAESARLIDVGAGSGAMIGWKSWNAPDRSDIEMCAVDMLKGDFFDQYTDFDVVTLGSKPTKFPGEFFDAAIISHLIEHVENRVSLAREIYRICKRGSKIYVEWPTYHSGSVVGKAALERFGVQCSTINFFDDGTHLALVTRNQAESVFVDAGFTLMSSGEIINDFLYPEMFRCGYAESDAEVTTYALWLALRFSQYLILEKA